MGWGSVLGGIGAALNPLGVATTALGLGGDIYSAYQGAQSQKDANAMNQLMAREQMQFQERMSSTAHQREVADLKAAGLNPLLSANAGASSPAGAMSTAQPVPSVGAHVMEGFMDKMRFANEVASAKQQRRVAKAQADLAEGEVDHMRQDPVSYYTAKSGPLDYLAGGFFNTAARGLRNLGRFKRDVKSKVVGESLKLRHSAQDAYRKGKRVLKSGYWNPKQGLHYKNER